MIDQNAEISRFVFNLLCQLGFKPQDHNFNDDDIIYYISDLMEQYPLIQGWGMCSMMNFLCHAIFGEVHHIRKTVINHLVKNGMSTDNATINQTFSQQDKMIAELAAKASLFFAACDSKDKNVKSMVERYRNTFDQIVIQIFVEKEVQRVFDETIQKINDVKKLEQESANEQSQTPPAP